ncbi:MAG: dihydrofolate reductase [Actinomycetota bacterium]|jgi:dihydrofolate reductase|nr:dihydrofolate reductase [Nocardioidaceae bacterium]MDQ3591729.1 dihydrofolate reductase [Actinomycetota bacterium]
MTVTLVAAVAANGVIGLDGGLPWPRTGDLVHFKELTLGHPLVLGRHTYDSIGRPLPGRTSIVVTRRLDWPAPDGVLVCHSVSDALDRADALDEEVFVIGGAEIYRAALPFADRLVLTHVHLEPDGDTWFPAVDWPLWREVSRTVHDGFDIATYERRE